MVAALLQGRFVEAFWLNPGLAVGLPAVVAWWLYKGELSTPAATVALVGAIAWGIFRNLLQL